MRRLVLVPAALVALLAVAPASPAATGEVVLSGTPPQLASFDLATPSVLAAGPVVDDLAAGDTIVGIDFRPATGQLYAVTRNGGAGRLYRVDVATGNTVKVADISVALTGAAFGISFNAVVDRLRIVSDGGQNIRVNPETGAAVTDSALAYPAAPGADDIVGLAYTNQFPGATVTSLFGYESSPDELVALPLPNTGMLSTIGPTGVVANQIASIALDAEPAEPALYAALHSAAGAGLFRASTDTGALTLVGTIPAPTALLGFAIRPAGVLRFAATTLAVAEDRGTVTIPVERVGGGYGTIGATVTATSAGAGAADFTPEAKPMSIAEGALQDAPALSLTDDDACEGDETFDVALSAPAGGALVVPPSTLQVTLIDDDQRGGPGALTLGSGAASVREGDGALTLAVGRTGGTCGPVSVRARTAPGSAGAADFTATETTLTFADGGAFATLTVPVAADGRAEGDESFTVELSEPGGGASLGSVARTTVTITDGVAPDRTKPVVLLSPDRTMKLAALLSSGLRAPFSCSEACTLAATLRTGKRVLGRATARLTAAGIGGVRVRVTRAQARRLRGRRSVPLVLGARVTDAAGNVTNASAKVSARR